MASKRLWRLVAAVAAVILLSTGSAVAGSLITSKQIKDNTILSRDIHDNTILSRDIHDNTILSRDIHDGTIKSRDIRDGAVKLQDLSEGAAAALSTSAYFTQDHNDTVLGAPYVTILSLDVPAGSYVAQADGIAFSVVNGSSSEAVCYLTANATVDYGAAGIPDDATRASIAMSIAFSTAEQTTIEVKCQGGNVGVNNFSLTALKVRSVS